jgi:large repetitive protein
VTVTVRGSGFLPVAGADLAIVGSGKFAASCPTPTACKVTLPAQPARTVTIQISAEDNPASPATKAGRYQYVAAPGVSSLAPAKSPAKGGTKVTIRGTNFTGVTSVRFGARAATGRKVISATELVATAPAGKGTVHVTVTAAGGTSSATRAASAYKYR